MVFALDCVPENTFAVQINCIQPQFLEDRAVSCGYAMREQLDLKRLHCITS